MIDLKLLTNSDIITKNLTGLHTLLKGTTTDEEIKLIILK